MNIGLITQGAIRDRKWICGCIALTIFAVCLGFYWAVTNHDFLAFDDDINIFFNPHLGQFDKERLKWMFTDMDYVRRYMPIGWITYSFVYWIGGLSPFAFHLACIVVHAANAVLVFCLSVSLSRKLFLGRPYEESLSVGVAACASLWWALSPLRVEVVAWASGLHTGLATFLLLLALILYVRAEQLVDSPVRRNLFALSGLTFFLSLLSYPIGLGAVFAPILYEIYLENRNREQFGVLFMRVWGTLKRKLGWWVVPWFAAFSITLMASVLAPTEWKTPEEFSIPAIVRLVRAPYACLYYVWKPWNPENLAVIYDSLYELSKWEPKLIISAVATLVVTVASAWMFLRQRYAWPLLWFLYLALFLPVSGLGEDLYMTSDRYAYPCSLAYLVFFALVSVHRRAALILCFVLLTTVGLHLPNARRQVAAWKNLDTLMTATVSHLSRHTHLRYLSMWRLTNHRFSYAGNIVGTREIVAMARRELKDEHSAYRIDRAFDGIQRTLDGLPSNVDSSVAVVKAAAEHWSFGRAELQIGHFRDAKEHFLAALALSPRFPEARFALAQSLISLNEPDRAASAFFNSEAIGFKLNGQDKRNFLRALGWCYAMNFNGRAARAALSQAGESLEDIKKAGF